MTREELKKHCQKQIDNCEMWAKAKGEEPSGKVYEEHKLILELLEQEPKTGHWIMPIQDDGMSDSIYYQVRCSNCDYDIDPQSWFLELRKYGADKYCPKCGAKMVEPQESENEK